MLLSLRSTALLAPVLLVLGALDSKAVAQTPGSHDVRTACTIPAPVDSLLPAEASPVVYTADDNGNIIIEIEDQAPISSWAEESSLPVFTGSSYFRWDGPDLFGTPGVGVLEYTIQIDTPGNYKLRLRCRHDHPDSSLENDCWIQVDNTPWDKLFNNEGPASVGIWTYEVKLDSTALKPIYNFTAGTHTIRLSGRSANFKMDRLVIYPQGGFGEGDFFPPSPYALEKPTIGQTLHLELDDPTDSHGISPGAQSLLFLSGTPAPGFPCGLPVPGVGELMLNFDTIQLGTQTWAGPGSPAVYSVPIPNVASLTGQTVYTQGLWIDPGAGAFPFTLTEGLDLTVGDV